MNATNTITTSKPPQPQPATRPRTRTHERPRTRTRTHTRPRAPILSYEYACAAIGTALFTLAAWLTVSLMLATLLASAGCRTPEITVRAAIKPTPAGGVEFGGCEMVCQVK